MMAVYPSSSLTLGLCPPTPKLHRTVSSFCLRQDSRNFSLLLPPLFDICCRTRDDASATCVRKVRDARGSRRRGGEINCHLAKPATFSKLVGPRGHLPRTARSRLSCLWSVTSSNTSCFSQWPASSPHDSRSRAPPRAPPATTGTRYAGPFGLEGRQKEHRTSHSRPSSLFCYPRKHHPNEHRLSSKASSKRASADTSYRLLQSPSAIAPPPPRPKSPRTPCPSAPCPGSPRRV